MIVHVIEYEYYDNNPGGYFIYATYAAALRGAREMLIARTEKPDPDAVRAAWNSVEDLCDLMGETERNLYVTYSEVTPDTDEEDIDVEKAL